MTASAPSCALVSALDEIGRWKDRTERDVGVALSELGREEHDARQCLEEARRRLQALALVRNEQEERLARVASEQMVRERAAVRAGLRADRAILAERSLRLQAAVGERDARMAEEIAANPDLADALAELERFREIELRTGHLPASYLRALREQRDRALRRLEPLLATPRAIEAPLAGVCVVLAVDPPEGPPEALVAVLPVSFAVYRDWATREEDLTTQFAYRMLAGVLGLLSELGVADAPVFYVEVQDSLAIQVWLGDATVDLAHGDFRERALEHLQAASEGAPELATASVEVYAIVVRPELLAEEDP